MQSQAHGFAVYEEKAPISMASYLPEEAANALAATVHVLLVFETECNQFSPSSPTYSPAWATAAASAASTLRP
jgi:hypothetical protein